jgi:hypothetical protein
MWNSEKGLDYMLERTYLVRLKLRQANSGNIRVWRREKFINPNFTIKWYFFRGRKNRFYYKWSAIYKMFCTTKLSQMPRNWKNSLSQDRVRNCGYYWYYRFRNSGHCYHSITTITESVEFRNSGHCYHSITTITESVEFRNSGHCYHSITTITETVGFRNSGYCYHSITTITETVGFRNSGHCYHSITTITGSVEFRNSGHCYHSFTTITETVGFRNSGHCYHSITAVNQ